jgi:hypothetical protein
MARASGRKRTRTKKRKTQELTRKTEFEN